MLISGHTYKGPKREVLRPKAREGVPHCFACGSYSRLFHRVGQNVRAVCLDCGASQHVRTIEERKEDNGQNSSKERRDPSLHKQNRFEY